MLNSLAVIKQSGIQFGTSGARGLVEQFKPDVCAAFTHAFISGIGKAFHFDKVAVAIDNRPSSPAMAQACIQAIRNSGFEAVYYGVIPTPALAHKAMQDGIPSIMITGSHIPFDRNGIKFYRPDGEISKADEQAILNASVEFEAMTELPELTIDPKAAQHYIARYTTPFESSLLAGKRIGIYEHSSAGRDLYLEIFTALGAEVVALERSDQFVPIDTEAVAESDKQKAKMWSEKYELDCIFSTDGDGDRPLVADENGDWLRGDILGLLCADAMQIEALAVPVSCNTAIELSQRFKVVERTRIGSPYVIAAFDALKETYHSVAGFEANGGFLLAMDTEINGRIVKALPTRDAVLPAIMLLMAGKDSGIAALVDSLPKRYTDSNRIQQFPTEQSQQILAKGVGSEAKLLSLLLNSHVEVEKVDTTDGLRITICGGDIVHLRPSGNAPELRCYAESSTVERASDLVERVLSKVKSVDLDLL